MLERNYSTSNTCRIIFTDVETMAVICQINQFNFLSLTLDGAVTAFLCI